MPQRKRQPFLIFFPSCMTNNTSTTKYDKWFECRLERKNMNPCKKIIISSRSEEYS